MDRAVAEAGRGPRSTKHGVALNTGEAADGEAAASPRSTLPQPQPSADAAPAQPAFA